MPKMNKGTKISDLAGSWDMTDEEAAEMEAAIEKSWENWRTIDLSKEPSELKKCSTKKKKTRKKIVGCRLLPV